jgi:hypothetical protein
MSFSILFRSLYLSRDTETQGVGTSRSAAMTLSDRDIASLIGLPESVRDKLALLSERRYVRVDYKDAVKEALLLRSISTYLTQHDDKRINSREFADEIRALSDEYLERLKELHKAAGMWSATFDALTVEAEAEIAREEEAR